MAGYTAAKRYAQMNHAIQDRVGNVIHKAQLVLKHLDGTSITTDEVKADLLGSVGGTNPSYSDDDGYVSPFYKHGDYLAEWTAHGDTTSRYIRIPPAFEDFAMVDVTKYDGVDETGATDSKAGIDAATAECAGRFKLFFPPGVYRADSRLNIKPGSHWVGCGPWSKIIAGPGNTGTLVGHPTSVGTDPITDVTIDSLLFDGNGPERTVTGQSVVRLGFGGIGGDNVTIRNCFFENAHEDDLNLFTKEITHLRILNNVIFGGGKDGISLHEDGPFLIANNLVIDCGDDGIALWGVTSGAVDGNVIVRSVETSKFGRSIVIGEGSRKVAVTGNYCEGNKRGGIEINADVSYSNIVGNVLVDAGNYDPTTSWGNGIQYQIPGNASGGGPWVSEHNNIVGNLIINPREHGIHIECESATVVNTMRHVNIADNMIVSDGIGNGAFKSTLGCGIHASHLPTNLSKIEHLSITNNRIFGFDQEGIIVTGIAGNTIRGLTVEGNKIFDSGRQALNDSDAIKLDYVQDFKVRNNTGEDTQTVGGQSQKGLYIAHPAGVAVVAGNDMLRNKTYAFSLNNFDAAANPVIRDNPGFSPWSGRATLAGGTAWTVVGGSVYKRTLVITFGVPIATGASPKIVAVASVDGWFVTISGITSTGFTANVFSAVGDPGSAASGTIHWQAEV